MTLQVSPALFFMETQPDRSEGEIPCSQDPGKLGGAVVDFFFLFVFKGCKFSCFIGSVWFPVATAHKAAMRKGMESLWSPSIGQPGAVSCAPPQCCDTLRGSQFLLQISVLLLLPFKYLALLHHWVKNQKMGVSNGSETVRVSFISLGEDFWCPFQHF